MKRLGIDCPANILCLTDGCQQPALRSELDILRNKYQRAIWFLQDIAAMSRKVGSETAAHALAQLGEPRSDESSNTSTATNTGNT